MATSQNSASFTKTNTLYSCCDAIKKTHTDEAYSSAWAQLYFLYFFMQKAA